MFWHPAGGTESILLAVKAARDCMAAKRGVTRPEMVVGPSAHAAYWKAAEYFNIRLVQAPLGPDFRCVYKQRIWVGGRVGCM